jgi:protein-tyrosine-phosphatase
MVSNTPARVRRVLFVCVENSNRSQMAEAFARGCGGGRIEAFSAGSRPAGMVNPRARAFMAERGYDLSQHQSKAISELPVGAYDAVVTMGCGDSCPSVPARLHVDWQIPDPRNLSDHEFRQVRDLIERKVKELLANLTEDD